MAKTLQISKEAESILVFAFSIILYRFIGQHITENITDAIDKTLAGFLAVILICEHFSLRAYVRHAQLKAEKRLSSIVALLLYALHAFALIALFTAILSGFYTNFELVPDYLIEFFGLIIFLKDISLFYSLSASPKKIKSDSQKSSQEVSLFHHLVALSVSVFIMLALWQKTMGDLTQYKTIQEIFGVSLLFTLTYFSSRIPFIIVTIYENRKYNFLRFAFEYGFVLILNLMGMSL